MQIYAAGLCEPNPGGYATWAFSACVENTETHNALGYMGKGSRLTQHIAEYRAVIEALKWAYQERHREFIVHIDSRLVVNQGMNRWAVKSPDLAPYYDRVRRGLLASHAVLEFIPQEHNERANELCRMAYREHTGSELRLEG